MNTDTPKTYQGQIIDFGVAPYQHNLNNSQSYFVQLKKTDGNEQTLWAMGLQEHIERQGIQRGEEVNLIDLGTKTGAKRREWEVERYQPNKDLVNSIEPDDAPEKQQPTPTGQTQLNQFNESQYQLNATEVPSFIKNNYVGMAVNRYLKDEKINYYDKDDNSSIAFEDRKNSLNTSRQDDKTIKAMLDLAESKGWSSIKLKGTEEFKQKVWLEAQIRGIETKGYTPTEQDKAELLIRQESRTTNQVVVEEQRDKATEPLDNEKEKNITSSIETKTNDFAKSQESAKQSEPQSRQDVPMISSITIDWTEKHGAINRTFSNFGQVQSWYQKEFTPEYIENKNDKSQITVHSENVPDEIRSVNYRLPIGIDYFNPYEQDLEQSYIHQYQEHYERFGVDLQKMMNNWAEYDKNQTYIEPESTLTPLNTEQTFVNEVSPKEPKAGLDKTEEEIQNLDHQTDSSEKSIEEIEAECVQSYGDNDIDFSELEQLGYDYRLDHSLNQNIPNKVLLELEERAEDEIRTGVWEGKIPDDRNVSRRIEARFKRYVNDYFAQERTMDQEQEAYVRSEEFNSGRDANLDKDAQSADVEQFHDNLAAPFVADRSQREVMQHVEAEFDRRIDNNRVLTPTEQSLHQHFTNVGKYPLHDDQLYAIELWRRKLVHDYKDHPDFVSKKLDDLNNKIPDISSGKFNLPTPPDIKVTPQVEVQTQDKGSPDRAR